MGQNHDELMSRAAALPVLKACGADSVVARKAQGPKVYDLDNIGYVDYLGGGGSSVVGFANQFVLDAVKKALESGVPVGFHVPNEVDLSEKLAQFLPWIGAWWFCRNPEEAMRETLAWARRTSGKDVIVGFQGGATVEPRAEMCPAGGAPAIREIASWKVSRMVDAITTGASEIAAVMVEPLMTRYGLIPLESDAVATVAEACRDAGIPLIFDERVSGFRLGRGGAAAWTGVTPDVAVYGSALGGGFPIGAVGFRGDFEYGDPGASSGPVATPHSVSLAAADAVLSILKNDTTYDRLEERSDQLANGIRNLADRFRQSIVVNRVGSVFALYLGTTAVASGTAAKRADSDAYRRLVRGLRDDGVLLPPSPGGTGFVSSAHGAKDIEETLAAFERVLLRFFQEDQP